ncbi:MAG: NAD(P)-dependent alcohol dehydrogenase [Streptosporangiales bacterium]
MVVAAQASVPETMSAAVLRGVGDLVVESRPVPEPGRGEVLVRVGSVGLCGSDVHYYRHGRIGEHVVREPLILGHEAGGTIVAVGPGADPERLGSRVSLEPGVPCRRCEQCRTGSYHLCPQVRFFATPPVDGAFCEYVAHDADFTYAVPGGVSDDAAGLLEPLSVGIWACRKAAVTTGSRVLVAGAGPIGIATVQAARAAGAATVVVTDIAAERLDSAGRLGATETRPADAAVADVRPGAFIDCSGAAGAVQAGVAAVRPGGRAVLVGLGADTVSLPTAAVQQREVTVCGTFRYANTWPTAIELAASGAVDLDGMVTGRYSLDGVVDAIAASDDARTVKSVVRP